MTSWAELWPPFALSIRLGRLEMHPVRFAEIPDLIDLISAGIVAEDLPYNPFANSFGHGEYTLAKQRESLSFWCSKWGSIKPEDWVLPMAVYFDDEIVGVQDVWAKDFPTARSAETGSFLGLAHQGKGIGTLMRQAIAMFAFDQLRAVELLSSAFDFNERSLAVSRKVGYEPNGSNYVASSESATEQIRFKMLNFRLIPQRLNRPQEELQVSGLAGFLDFLGLTAPAS